MLSNGKIRSLYVCQGNDARCFNASSNDQKGSVHNKRAKRKSSKKLRQFLKKDQDE